MNPPANAVCRECLRHFSNMCYCDALNSNDNEAAANGTAIAKYASKVKVVISVLENDHQRCIDLLFNGKFILTKDILTEACHHFIGRGNAKQVSFLLDKGADVKEEDWKYVNEESENEIAAIITQWSNTSPVTKGVFLDD